MVEADMIWASLTSEAMHATTVTHDSDYAKSSVGYKKA